jgi:hypothetical protein
VTGSDREATTAPDFNCLALHKRPDPVQPFSSFRYREQVAIRSVIPSLEREERIMPVLLMWAVPAVIVIGGASYWFLHLH